MAFSFFFSAPDNNVNRSALVTNSNAERDAGCANKYKSSQEKICRLRRLDCPRTHSRLRMKKTKKDERFAELL